jgi:hypothetical protein
MARHLFVLGTGRCGSTLVNELLAGHEHIGYVSVAEDRFGRPASALAPALNEAYRRLAPFAAASNERRAGGGVRQRVGRLTLRRLGPSEAYHLLDREVSPALSVASRDLTAADATPWLRERFRRAIETRADRLGAAVFLHKFTGWPRVGFIQAAFPDARFVHVVRDGRAVANSLLQMPWWHGWLEPPRWGFGPLPPALERAWDESGRRYPLLAGLEWKVLVDRFDDVRAEVAPERWLELRYEDFVRDAAGLLRSVLAHAGLDETPRFRRFRDAFPVSAGRTDSYRRELGADDVRLLDAVLGESLRRHGYPVPG